MAIKRFDWSGITNYVAKWTSGNNLSTSQVYDNGTNVGVGTIWPQAKLQVNGDIRAISFRFPNGTIAAGSWEIKTKTYALSVSDCGGSGFTSWKG